MKWMKVFFQYYGQKKEGEQMFDEEEVKKDKPIDFDDLSVEEIELMIKDHQEQIEILKNLLKQKKEKLDLAKNHAIGIPNTNTIRAAEKLTNKESKKASRMMSLPRRSDSPDHGILCRSPISGDRRNKIAIVANRTTVFGILFIGKIHD